MFSILISFDFCKKIRCIFVRSFIHYYQLQWFDYHKDLFPVYVEK